MNFVIDKSGWRKTRLNDVVEWYQKDIANEVQVDYGIKFYVTASQIDSDSVKFDRYNYLDDGQKGPTITKHFQKGDLLLSTRSVALRKAAIAPIDGVTGEKLLVLRVKKKSELLNQLFPFIFQSIDFWEFAQNSASGSVNKFTSWTKIREYEFLLPPKDQQANLAELLWTINEVIESEIRLLNEVYRSKRTVRKILIDGELHAKKEFKIGNLESKWPFVKLGNISTIKGRIGWRGLKQSEYVQDGPYLIAGKHINEGKINWEQCDMITNERYEESMEIALKTGDVIFSKDGAIGNPALIYDLPNKATINSTMMLLRPKSNLDPEYLYQILNSVYFDRLKIRCLSGSAIPHIFQGDMKNFEFPFPPLEEQQRIGKILKQFDNNIDKIKSKLITSKGLQKSIINQIF